MLEAPITKKDTHEFKFPCGSVGISGMQGWRIEMEDAHLAVSMPSLPDHVYLCVFDGHGGAGASAYAAKNIVSVIEGTETWKKYVASSKKDPVMVGEALEEAFIALDVNLRAFQQTAENNGDTSGTTVNTCMVTPNHYICANAGDSRCVLGSSNKTIAMSVDHKPTDPIERTRIEKAGGTVQM